MTQCVMKEFGMTESEIVHTFQTADGNSVRLCPLRPDDAKHLVDLFKHMGPESRFLRFNLSLTNPDPRLIWSEAQRMAQVAPGDGAWLAFADLPEQANAPVGGVRFIRTADDTAEASLVVRDDMQRKGIGTEMLRFLLCQARAAGIRKLTATAQRGNLPLWRILQKAPLAISRQSQGAHTVIEADLTTEEPA
jgi:RimJ/RimL family protein N-acetyltransferase